MKGKCKFFLSLSCVYVVYDCGVLVFNDGKGVLGCTFIVISFN